MAKGDKTNLHYWRTGSASYLVIMLRGPYDPPCLVTCCTTLYGEHGIVGPISPSLVRIAEPRLSDCEEMTCCQLHSWTAAEGGKLVQIDHQGYAAFSQADND